MKTKILSRHELKDVLETSFFLRKFVVQEFHDKNNDIIYNIMSDDGLLCFELNILEEEKFRLILQRLFSTVPLKEVEILNPMFKMLELLGEKFQVLQVVIHWSFNHEDDAYYRNNVINNELELINAGYRKTNNESYVLNIYDENDYQTCDDLMSFRALKILSDNLKISKDECDRVNSILKSLEVSLKSGVESYQKAYEPLNIFCQSILQKVLKFKNHKLEDFKDWCIDNDNTTSDHIYFENESFKIVAFIDYDYGYCLAKFSIVSKEFDLKVKSSVVFY